MTTSSDHLSPPESPPVQPDECVVDVRAVSRKGALLEDASDGPAQLLEDVPEERRISVVWSGLNAHVPIFNAQPSMRERAKRSIPCWPSASKSSSGKQQVRILWLRGAGTRASALAHAPPQYSHVLSLACCARVCAPRSTGGGARADLRGS